MVQRGAAVVGVGEEMNNKRTGNRGENVAAAALRLRGIQCVSKIATPHRRIKTPPYIVYDEKVAGDHRGILPNGIGVLAESKTISGDRLNYSELKPHQHQSLKDWNDNNGLALIVWVSDYGVFVMEYFLAGLKGLEPKSSLSINNAKQVDMTTTGYIEGLLKLELKDD